jgi:hypothetical protein
MTPEQRRGRIYLFAFVGVLLLSDVVLKLLLLSAGRARPGHVVGTILTFALCWWLWRGSKFAYAATLACVAIAAVYLLVLSPNSPIFAAVSLAILAVLTLALVAPATRSFIEYRRSIAPNYRLERP